MIVYSLKSVSITTEYINDHNNTNKRINCLNFICALKKRLVNYSIALNDKRVKWEEESRQT